jgi:hypothetical protein
VVRVRSQFLVVLGAAVFAGGLAVLPLGAAASAAQARPTTAAGGWGKAILLARPAGVTAIGVSSLSCHSPGSCEADGSYSGTAFVIGVTHGTWGHARPVRFPFAGNCVVTGSYTGKSGQPEPFTLIQKNGTWGKAAAVAGLASLNPAGSAGIGSISCPSAGNCTATGSYSAPGSQYSLPFTVSEVHGTWGDAAAVPGIAALPGLVKNRGAGTGPLSCGSAGNCTATGTYPVDVDESGGDQAYVASEVNGTWGNATAVPGLTALNTGVEDSISSISCPAAGTCGAVGYYWTSTQFMEGFVVSEVNGTWHRAIEVPGTAKLDGTEVSTVSCASAGNCTAGGLYGDNGLCPCDFGTGQLFVVSEVNGTWYRATPLPGGDKLNQGDDAGFSTIFCPKAGNCAAGGSYSTFVNDEGINDTQAFVATETGGTWSRAVEVPGTETLNNRDIGNISSISCAAPGKCSAVGNLESGKTGFQTYLVTRS